MRLTILEPLRRPALRRLVSAQFLAETGDGIITVALPLYVFAQTDSATATSLTFSAQMIAGSVLGVVGGVAADRFNRQRVLVLAFTARALLLVACAMAGPLWLTITLGVAARSLGQLDNPSFDALIPGLAINDMQQVLAVRRFIQSVSIVVGPAVGALAVWGFGEQETIAISAIPFVFAILIHLRLTGVDADRADRRAHHSTAGTRELVSGMTIVLTTPVVRRMVFYWSASVACVAVAMAAAIIWFTDELESPDYWYGLSISAYGIGAALGLLLVGGMAIRRSVPNVMLASAPVYAISCAMCVAFEVPWLMAIGWLLWGIAMGPEMVKGEPEFVARIRPELRGRAFAGVGVANTLGMAAGYAVAGPLLDRFGARDVTYGTAVVILLIGTLWIGPARRGLAPRPIFDEAVEIPRDELVAASLADRIEHFGH